MQVHKLEPPKKTFFYERPNGSIIEVEEREASKIHNKFKQVGVSDGKTFFKAVQEAHKIFQEEGQVAALARIDLGKKEELEVARGNLQVPKVVNVYGNGANYMNKRV